MLITTSRHPCHRARLLGRELARVLADAEYVPRGTKSVRDLTSLARSRAHELAMIVNSRDNSPKELRFLEVGRGWRWLDARIELSGVKLQKDFGQKVSLGVKKIVRGSSRAGSFSSLLGELLHLESVEKPPRDNPVAFVKGYGELQIGFRDSKGEQVGPIIYCQALGSEWPRRSKLVPK